MSVDLSQLPAPNVVQPLDFEAEFSRLQSLVLQDMPEMADVLGLESEPATKLLQRWAYENVAMQDRINHSAKAVMLAYAVDEDLDVAAANNGVQRLAGETDDQLRRRAQMAFEGLTVAGSHGSYIFHALGADADVLDAMPITIAPGIVRVYVLSRLGDGTAGPELLQKVLDALSPDDVRPMNDTVEVASAEVLRFAIKGQLRLYPGPASATALERAETALATYLASCRRLGYDVADSGTNGALHVQGVQKVVLESPEDDVVVQPHQVAYCTGVDIQLAEGSHV